LIEQVGETQLINQPIITITINDGFVKVENNNNIIRHFFSLRCEKVNVKNFNDLKKKLSLLSKLVLSWFGVDIVREKGIYREIEKAKTEDKVINLF